MQNLFYNITGEQTLVWDAPEGRPSAITSVSVFAMGTGDDGTAEAATSGSPSVETNPNTTFDAASGVSTSTPRALNLTATTGIEVGRSYLATNAAGESERIDVTEVIAGVSASARHHLVNDYAAADTLVSTRISIAVDDTWIADSANISDDSNPNPGFRVRWVYVVDGVTRVRDDYFNVVRYRADHDVLPKDVALVRVNWITSLPVEHQEDNGMQLIEDAYTDVKFDLHRNQIAAEMLRNRSVVNRLTIRKAILMASENRAAETGDTIAWEMDKDTYETLLAGLITVSGNTAIADDTTGAGKTIPPGSILER